jgi:hypothetical protein
MGTSGTTVPRMNVAWGRPFGCYEGPSYYTPVGPVWLHRKGSRCRFFNDLGEQVGPEQLNVGPAVAYAHHKGWSFDHRVGV